MQLIIYFVGLKIGVKNESVNIAYSFPVAKLIIIPMLSR